MFKTSSVRSLKVVQLITSHFIVHQYSNFHFLNIALSERSAKEENHSKPDDVLITKASLPASCVFFSALSGRTTSSISTPAHPPCSSRDRALWSTTSTRSTVQKMMEECMSPPRDEDGAGSWVGRTGSGLLVSDGMRDEGMSCSVSLTPPSVKFGLDPLSGVSS